MLIEQQLLDPANPVLAHDIGLYHYWRARKENNPEKAAAHWERVIGNWAMVLENETYWKEWCAERQEVYGKPITAEDIAHAKKALIERIVLDLTKSSANGSLEADGHLEAAFFVELKALHLLKQTRGIPLPGKNNQRLECGPILARQLEIFNQGKHSLPLTAETLHNKHHSIDIIMAPLKKGSDGPAENYNNVDRHLRLCFSQLGIPFIYLERGEPQRTLKVLANLRCPACEPPTNEPANDQVISRPLPTRCREDCAHFAQFNPAYNFGPAGRELFNRHAVELSAGARLSLAQQTMAEEPLEIKGLLDHIQEALNTSQSIDIREVLQEEVADIMLGWAEGLLRKERWDDAIALLKNTENFEKGERWKGKLAGALNARGVQRANEKHWQESVDDLREAHRLNPFVPLFRQNLENVLLGYADEAYRAGDVGLKYKLLDEVLRLGETQPQEQEAKPSPVQIPEEKDKIPMPVFVYKEDERRNPALFDSRGKLQLEVLEDSGKTVLELAKEEAATVGEYLLRVPALLIALTRYEGGEILRLLALQGTQPEKPQAQARNSTVKYVDSKPLKTTSVLSQFNLWFSVLKIFDLAWEIAAYDRGKIGEPHIFFGLLVSRSAKTMLEVAGVNIEKMIQQAGWH